MFGLRGLVVVWRGESEAKRNWDRRTLLILLGFAGGVFLLLEDCRFSIAWASHLRLL